MTFKKLAIATALVATMTGCASTGSRSVSTGATSNWWRAMNSNAQYVDPCDGYRNRVKPHFEKSVRISNSVDPQSVDSIIRTYLVADMKYRYEEDEFMKAHYPKWWEIANNSRNTQTQTQLGDRASKYSVGRVGFPRGYYINRPMAWGRMAGDKRVDLSDSTSYGQLNTRVLRSLVLDKPQAGYLTMTLYRHYELAPKPGDSGPLFLHNHPNYGYLEAGGGKPIYHWEAGRTLWQIYETPRSYYRCPMEHPLWNTPKWRVMMNCVENGVCSAQVITHIR